MVTNDKKAEILKCVANGGTLQAAGASIGVSATRAKQLLARICRELELSSSADEIRAEPEKYFARLDAFKEKPQYELRKALVSNLTSVLRLKVESELTPRYLSNITAAQLINAGVTLVAIGEIQEWLCKHGLSLKRRPPESEKELAEIKRAIAVLDVFHFDISVVNQQLLNL